MSKGIGFAILWLMIGVIQACAFDLVMFAAGQLHDRSTELWGWPLFPYWWGIAAAVSFVETWLFGRRIAIWWICGAGGPGLRLPE